MKKLTIIDGNSLLFRCFYATYYPGSTIMQTKSGIPTNAIFAFSNMMSKIISNLDEDEGLFVCFDKDSQTFRREANEKYKANRKPAPEELKIQFPIAREFLNHLGIAQYEVHGYEADDIAGTLANIADKANIKVNIYTSDKDYIQLISENVTLSLIRKGLSDINILTPETAKEQFGFEPIKIIDYKGLRGDSSDNLPGILGIGEKGAVKLIEEYGDFDNIIAHKDEIKGKMGDAIRAHYEDGILSRDMAIIIKDVPLPFTLEDTIYKGYDFKSVSEFANKYELKQLITKLPTKYRKKDKLLEKIDVKKINSFIEINIKDSIGIYLDIYGNYHEPKIASLYFSDGNNAYQMSVEDFKNDKLAKEILENPNIKKIGFDLKKIAVSLSSLGICLEGYDFDLLVASYLLDSSNLKNVESVFAYFGIDLRTSDTVSLFENDSEIIEGKIVLYPMLLKEKIIKELEKVDALNLFKDLEMPLVKVLAKMEIEGFPIDIKLLEEIGKTYKEKLDGIEKEIITIAGKDFNVASTKQLAEVLYDDLKLNAPKSRSTANDILLELINEHPIIPLIISYRKYFKLYTTYIEGLKNHIHSDKKIHATFNQVETTTGRLSSSNPNLQNISVRDEEGKLIRKCFYYDDNNIEILSLDYSQIELRILAHLSKCDDLINVFKKDEDIHSSTARAIFNLDREPNSLERRKAKAVNFGIVYGISDFGLSEQLNISIKEAKEIINTFYVKYPQIKDFLSEVINNAIENGYVSTMSGRRRYLRELHDSNYAVREFAKRAAMNAPIQGSAADLIKLAMIKVDKELEERKLKSKMVLQIHDELIFKVYKDEKDIVKEIVTRNMEGATNLIVPLKVDGGFGKSWYDAK